MEHHIHRTRQFTQAPLHSRAHAPANAIALHRSSQYFTHGKADSRPSLIVALAEKHSHVPRKLLPASLIYGLKIRMFQQA